MLDKMVWYIPNSDELVLANVNGYFTRDGKILEQLIDSSYIFQGWVYIGEFN